MCERHRSPLRQAGHGNCLSWITCKKLKPGAGLKLRPESEFVRKSWPNWVFHFFFWGQKTIPADLKPWYLQNWVRPSAMLFKLCCLHLMTVDIFWKFDFDSFWNVGGKYTAYHIPYTILPMWKMWKMWKCEKESKYKVSFHSPAALFLPTPRLISSYTPAITLCLLWILMMIMLVMMMPMMKRMIMMIILLYVKKQAQHVLPI